MRLAERMSRLGTESAFAVLAKAAALEAQGRRVLHLEIGEPDFPTPPHVVAAAEQALASGHTQLRRPRPASRRCASRWRRTWTAPAGCGPAADRVVITPGGKPVMFFTHAGAVPGGRRGDLPRPRLPDVRLDHRRRPGRVAVPLPLREEHGFRLDPDELRRAGDAPHPGARPQLAAQPVRQRPDRGGRAGGRADRPRARPRRPERRDLLLARLRRRVPAACWTSTGMPERTVLLDGWSKTFAMTGWRLGYGVFPAGAGRAGHPAAGQLGVVRPGVLAARRRGRPRGTVGRRRRRCARSTGSAATWSSTALNAHRRGQPACCPAARSTPSPNVRALGRLVGGAGRRAARRRRGGLPAGHGVRRRGEGFLRLSYAASRDRLSEALDAIERHLGGLPGTGG